MVPRTIQIVAVRLGLIFSAMVVLVALGVVLLASKGVKAAPGILPSVDSKVSLVPDEDLNHNGLLDGGDSVKFEYTITNPTRQGYAFASLNTHVDSSSWNFIRNIHGTTGVSQSGKEIILNNLVIGPGETRIIDFEMTANLNDADVTTSTTPELISANKSVLARGSVHQVEAKATRVDPAERQSSKTEVAK